MKILFVNTNIGYGGASKMMAWVASQCADNGHEVVFFTYREEKCNQSISKNVEHFHKQLEDKDGTKKDFVGCVKFIHDYIKKENFEVAVSFLYPSHIRLALACVGTNCRVLFSERGDPFQKPKSIKGKIVNFFSQKIFCTADAFVFQTSMAASYFPKRVQQKSVVICNPVKPLIRTKERVVGGDKNIVCLARLDIHQKRQDILIEAFNIISSRYPDYSLLLYGDGSKYDEEILREKANNNRKIIFMGATKDVVSAIQNATMTVLSSDYEGIPNSLLESMSLGVPSISTDCSPGGAAMLIKNKENGILVQRGNAKELAEAIEYMITHRSEAEQMGKRGMYVNEVYSENVIAEKWFNMINALKK